MCTCVCYFMTLKGYKALPSHSNGDNRSLGEVGGDQRKGLANSVVAQLEEAGLALSLYVFKRRWSYIGRLLTSYPDFYLSQQCNCFINSLSSSLFYYFFGTLVLIVLMSCFIADDALSYCKPC